MLFHVNSDYISDDELFVKINDGTGSCIYGILNINNQTITELGIECVTNSGDVSVLSDYSKLALQIDYDQGIMKVYDLPSFSEQYTIDKDYQIPIPLMKNEQVKCGICELDPPSELLNTFSDDESSENSLVNSFRQINSN